MIKIHPTAIVAPSAELGDGVEVAPYTIIDGNVKIGDGTIIGPHAWITGRTTIGRNNKIHMGCSIGNIPQDLKFKGEDSELIIGDSNIIREYCTVNLGTAETGKTVIGDRNLLMAYVHIAHDCYLDSDIILANCTQAAGHVEIHDRAIVGGMTAIHQFCRIGAFSMIGAETKIVKDVLPFSLVDGVPAKCVGANSTGLKRNGFAGEDITALRKAFRLLLYSKILRDEAMDEIGKLSENCLHISDLLGFIKESKRGFVHRK